MCSSTPQFQLGTFINTEREDALFELGLLKVLVKLLELSTS